MSQRFKRDYTDSSLTLSLQLSLTDKTISQAA